MKRLAFVLLVVLSSCDTRVQVGGCSTSTCPGCCDANDQCVSGSDVLACGSGGNACQQCAQGTTCGLGICVVGTSGGGSGGGTGGGSGGGSVGGSGGGGDKPVVSSTCLRPQFLQLMDFGSPGKQRAIAQGTTIGASDTEGSFLSSCGGDGSGDQTYQVVVQGGRWLSIKAIRSGSWRPSVKLRTRVCTEPDDRCAIASVGGTTASIDQFVTATTTFTITVDGADATSGAYELQIETRVDSDGGTQPDFCTRLLAAQRRFFADAGTCMTADAGVTPTASEPQCSMAYSLCSPSEVLALQSFLGCYEASVTCTAGQEATALTDFDSCMNRVRGGAVGGTCADVL